MACETRLRPRQSRVERAAAVRAARTRFNDGLASGKVKPVVDKKTGAIAFTGLTETERDGVEDACVYRHIMSNGSMQAKLAIQKAELLAGRTVSQSAVNSGIHSHDGGRSWHPGH